MPETKQRLRQILLQKRQTSKLLFAGAKLITLKVQRENASSLCVTFWFWFICIQLHIYSCAHTYTRSPPRLTFWPFSVKCWNKISWLLRRKHWTTGCWNDRDHFRCCAYRSQQEVTQSKDTFTSLKIKRTKTTEVPCRSCITSPAAAPVPCQNMCRLFER